MEIFVRFGSIDNVKVAVAPNKEGDLFAKISFEAPLNIESIARLFNMARESNLLFCTFASSQLALDLKLEQVEVKVKEAKIEREQPVKEGKTEKKVPVPAGV